MVKCEDCGKELKQGEMVWQGDILHDLTTFPPVSRVPYWCNKCGKNFGAKKNG